MGKRFAIAVYSMYTYYILCIKIIIDTKYFISNYVVFKYIFNIKQSTTDRKIMMWC